MDDNNWDLFAVVKSCSAAAPPLPPDLLPLPEAEEIAAEGKGDAWWFPDTSAGRHELDELYKPFYVKPGRPQPPLLMTKPSCPSSAAAAASIFPAGLPTVPYRFQRLQAPQAHRPVSQTSRSKRRKNQQKKVVCQVPADGAVSSDMWAWRKYGQKPIKGSPFPRGYYRCSSSKGCQARKQVERSRADPGMLVITYTAEHNHPVPTHRNSLSGSTRQKLPPPPEPSLANGEQLPSSSPGAARRFLPTTEKGDGEEDLDEVVMEDEDDDDDVDVLTVGDVEMMGEEEMLFLGMEVIDASAAAVDADKSPATVSVRAAFFEEDDFFPSPWLAKNNTAAAAGGS